MGKTVTLNGNTYIVPDANEENYGEELQSLLLEVVNTINTISAPLDLPKTDFNFINNQTTPAAVSGLIFPTGDVTKFRVDYVIVRDNGINKIVESGALLGYQNGSDWELSRDEVQNNVTNANFSGSAGTIGLEFSIDGSGQIYYTSNNYTGQTTGLLSYKATTITQD